jgi:hypothetical protein
LIDRLPLRTYTVGLEDGEPPTIGIELMLRRTLLRMMLVLVIVGLTGLVKLSYDRVSDCNQLVNLRSRAVPFISQRQRGQTSKVQPVHLQIESLAREPQILRCAGDVPG